MKISHALIAFCIGLFMTGFSYADNTYKSTTVFKTDFQNQDWNGVKITVGTLKGVNKTIGSSIANIYYTLAERKQGDISAGGKGQLKMIGSTGKYKGVTSTCEYTAKYLPENWLVVESECVKD